MSAQPFVDSGVVAADCNGIEPNAADIGENSPLIQGNHYIFYSIRDREMKGKKTLRNSFAAFFSDSKMILL